MAGYSLSYYDGNIMVMNDCHIDVPCHLVSRLTLLHGIEL